LSHTMWSWRVIGCLKSVVSPRSSMWVTPLRRMSRLWSVKPAESLARGLDGEGVARALEHGDAIAGNDGWMAGGPFHDLAGKAVAEPAGAGDGDRAGGEGADNAAGIGGDDGVGGRAPAPSRSRRSPAAPDRTARPAPGAPAPSSRSLGDRAPAPGTGCRHRIERPASEQAREQRGHEARRRERLGREILDPQLALHHQRVVGRPGAGRTESSPRPGRAPTPAPPPWSPWVRPGSGAARGRSRG
jgi:hypothetical protein